MRYFKVEYSYNFERIGFVPKVKGFMNICSKNPICEKGVKNFVFSNIKTLVSDMKIIEIKEVFESNKRIKFIEYK